MNNCLKFVFTILLIAFANQSVKAQSDKLTPGLQFKLTPFDSLYLKKTFPNQIPYFKKWNLEVPPKNLNSIFSVIDVNTLPISTKTPSGNIHILPTDNMPCLVPYNYFSKTSDKVEASKNENFYIPVKIPNPYKY